MNEPIDIVLTYVDSTDKQWQKAFKQMQNKEVRKGILDKSDCQAFGEDRFRNWDTLKYWFRGVEQNCPWVNKIFFIVQSESQIPEWLDTTNPKLRIVYHKEYIPSRLLPVFNSRPIELYTCKIKDLSKNYIRCNDDCYFINPVEEERFFRNNKPVLPDNKREFKFFNAEGKGAPFWGALNNNMTIEQEYLNGRNYNYGIAHLQTPCDKEFELEILNKYYGDILKRNSYSHFKNEKQYNVFLYDNLERLCDNATIDENVYENCSYLFLNPELDYDEVGKKIFVCLNDTDKANENFDLVYEQLHTFFDNKFPNKSSYEK